MLDPTAPRSAALRALVLRSVPTFSDYCGIATVANGRPAQYVLETPPALDRPDWERMLRTPVFVPGRDGRPGEHVILLHWWHDRRRPSLPDALTALTMADQALRASAAPQSSTPLHSLRFAS